MVFLALVGQCVPVTGRQALAKRPSFQPVVHVSALRRSIVSKAGNPESNLTGEWSANWSLASYEDVGEYFNDNLFKEEAAPSSLLSDIMSTDMAVATPETTTSDLKAMLTTMSGLPVVESSTCRKLLGVVSKRDLEKSGTTVKEIMSTPAVAARPTSKVADAAVLMLKHKVHRIPIVDDDAMVVGIVTRTDIFTAMALQG